MTSQKYQAAIYTVEIKVARSTQEVFNHIIDLSKWWPEKFEGPEISLNSEFVLTTGDAHFSKNKVLEFTPDRMFVWLTTGSIRKSDNFDWTGTKFIFELKPISEGTLIQFTYDGVVIENEYERLKQICDLTIKEILYNFIVNGQSK